MRTSQWPEQRVDGRGATQRQHPRSQGHRGYLRKPTTTTVRTSSATASPSVAIKNSTMRSITNGAISNILPNRTIRDFLWCDLRRAARCSHPSHHEAKNRHIPQENKEEHYMLSCASQGIASKHHMLECGPLRESARKWILCRSAFDAPFFWRANHSGQRMGEKEEPQHRREEVGLFREKE